MQSASAWSSGGSGRVANPDSSSVRSMSQLAGDSRQSTLLDKWSSPVSLPSTSLKFTESNGVSTVPLDAVKILEERFRATTARLAAYKSNSPVTTPTKSKNNTSTFEGTATDAQALSSAVAMLHSASPGFDALKDRLKELRDEIKEMSADELKARSTLAAKNRRIRWTDSVGGSPSTSLPLDSSSAVQNNSLSSPALNRKRNLRDDYNDSKSSIGSMLGSGSRSSSGVRRLRGGLTASSAAAAEALAFNVPQGTSVTGQQRVRRLDHALQSVFKAMGAKDKNGLKPVELRNFCALLRGPICKRSKDANNNTRHLSPSGRGVPQIPAFIPTFANPSDDYDGDIAPLLGGRLDVPVCTAFALSCVYDMSPESAYDIVVFEEVIAVATRTADNLRVLQGKRPMKIKKDGNKNAGTSITKLSSTMSRVLASDDSDDSDSGDSLVDDKAITTRQSKPVNDVPVENVIPPVVLENEDKQSSLKLSHLSLSRRLQSPPVRVMPKSSSQNISKSIFVLFLSALVMACVAWMVVVLVCLCIPLKEDASPHAVYVETPLVVETENLFMEELKKQDIVDSDLPDLGESNKDDVQNFISISKEEVLDTPKIVLEDSSHIATSIVENNIDCESTFELLENDIMATSHWWSLCPPPDPSLKFLIRSWRLRECVLNGGGTESDVVIAINNDRHIVLFHTVLSRMLRFKHSSYCKISSLLWSKNAVVMGDYEKGASESMVISNVTESSFQPWYIRIPSFVYSIVSWPFRTIWRLLSWCVSFISSFFSTVIRGGWSVGYGTISFVGSSFVTICSTIGSTLLSVTSSFSESVAIIPSKLQDKIVAGQSYTNRLQNATSVSYTYIERAFMNVSNIAILAKENTVSFVQDILFRGGSFLYSSLLDIIGILFDNMSSVCFRLVEIPLLIWSFISTSLAEVDSSNSSTNPLQTRDDYVKEISVRLPSGIFFPMYLEILVLLWMVIRTRTNFLKRGKDTTVLDVAYSKLSAEVKDIEERGRLCYRPESLVRYYRLQRQIETKQAELDALSMRIKRQRTSRSSFTISVVVHVVIPLLYIVCSAMWVPVFLLPSRWMFPFSWFLVCPGYGRGSIGGAQWVFICYVFNYMVYTLGRAFIYGFISSSLVSVKDDNLEFENIFEKETTISFHGASLQAAFISKKAKLAKLEAAASDSPQIYLLEPSVDSPLRALIDSKYSPSVMKSQSSTVIVDKASLRKQDQLSKVEACITLHTGVTNGAAFAWFLIIFSVIVVYVGLLVDSSLAIARCSDISEALAGQQCHEADLSVSLLVLFVVFFALLFPRISWWLGRPAIFCAAFVSNGDNVLGGGHFPIVIKQSLLIVVALASASITLSDPNFSTTTALLFALGFVASKFSVRALAFNPLHEFNALMTVIFEFLYSHPIFSIFVFLICSSFPISLKRTDIVPGASALRAFGGRWFRGPKWLDSTWAAVLAEGRSYNGGGTVLFQSVEASNQQINRRQYRKQYIKLYPFMTIGWVIVSRLLAWGLEGYTNTIPILPTLAKDLVPEHPVQWMCNSALLLCPDMFVIWASDAVSSKTGIFHRKWIRRFFRLIVLNRVTWLSMCILSFLWLSWLCLCGGWRAFHYEL